MDGLYPIYPLILCFNRNIFMSQLTSVFCRVSKIAKDWCFLKHSQCWGSESCYQFHGWHWVGNAGIFHPTICSFNRWIDQHMGSHQGLGFLKKPSCSTGESSCSSLKWLYTAQHWCIGGKSLIFGGYPIETEKYTSNWWLNPLRTHLIKAYKNRGVHSYWSYWQ